MRAYSILAMMVLVPLTTAHGLEPGQYPPCKHASLEYSVGATICECPSLKAAGGIATGGPPSSVTSRRLVCKTGVWVPDTANCVELSYSGSGHAAGDHKKLHEMYCPRASFAEQASGYIENATPSQGVMILAPLCRRFSIPASACAAAIEAISKVTK
jgi:hypothetical protein